MCGHTTFSVARVKLPTGNYQNTLSADTKKALAFVLDAAILCLHEAGKRSMVLHSMAFNYQTV
jgi:hypothetical protein